VDALLGRQPLAQAAKHCVQQLPELGRAGVHHPVAVVKGEGPSLEEGVG
jgi:hypothetical protein